MGTPERCGSAARLRGLVAVFASANLFLLWGSPGYAAQAQPAPAQLAPATLVLAAERLEAQSALEILYPQSETLFPPDIVAPTFRWTDRSEGASRWHVLVRFDDGESMGFDSDEPSWRPSESDWERIKQKSLERDADVIVAGVDPAAPEKLLSADRIRIRTSRDEVGDALFYREVPLPFLEAVQDPARIRWRFGTIDMEDGPPVVLENLPVCGNCHSFSDNASVLGLDVDYGNDKGAYGILPVAKNMVMNDEKIITWADYKPEDDEMTFGLLSRVSPTGRYVISTVKDRSVFVAVPDIEFSQLFFPIKGILVVYDRETGEFKELPGADDPRYVQTNPVWSPDGREILFARAKVFEAGFLNQKNNALLSEEDVPEFTRDKKPFRYDIYRIPFNDGKGGEAVPLEGASRDGRSNYFPKYSPDGKWIIFCKADSYMLLMPDSELYIVPTAGGPARRLRYNTARMNSWHSWSSNSKWLVFSSKVNTPYTQLFLTHIDEDGNDSPPVLLERFASPDRAANIPEFVDLAGDAIVEIREEFLDAYSFLRAGIANERTGDFEGAVRAFRRGLEIEPDNAEILNALGWTLYQNDENEAAVEEYRRALRADPSQPKTHNNLALVLIDLGRIDEAAEHYKKSIEIEPKADILADYGALMAYRNHYEEALESYHKALELDPGYAAAHRNMAVALTTRGKYADAERHYRSAIESEESVEAYNGLGYVLAAQQRSEDAIAAYRRAVEISPEYGAAYNNLAEVLRKAGRLEEAAAAYRKSLALRPSASIHAELGVVLRKLGKNEEAESEFRSALALDSDNRKARRNLSMLEQSL